ncbi:transposase [Rhodococcus opacus PD630]|nr:hypothetical protein Pd630_LPD16087 [Rhodococcus opacus PD630]EHI43568.1 transposase [Rhodococcus opacus PD630]
MTAEVAEIDFIAFTCLASERTPGWLVVRRIPDLRKHTDGQGALFDTWRFHAFFTTTDPAVLDTVAADKVHRGHAIIEQVHADLTTRPRHHRRREPRPPAVFAAADLLGIRQETRTTS